MSSQNDPLAAAKQAERDLNSNAAKQGFSKGDSGTSLFLALPLTHIQYSLPQRRKESNSLHLPLPRNTARQRETM